MTLSTVFWIAVLSQVPAEAPEEAWRQHEAECYRREDAGDHAAAGDACRRAFETVPDGPAALDQRSLFVFKALRLYKRARGASGDVEPLCSAAAVLRAFGAQLDALPAGERASDRADVADSLQAIEPQIAGSCVEPADDLIDVRRVGPRRATTGSRPPPPPRPPPGPDATPRRRPLRIAGGAALGAGLGLGAAAIAMLSRATDMQAQVDALSVMYPAGVRIPDASWSDYQEATSRGEQADRLAIGFGVPALGLALTGVALLAVDAHRERSGRRVALHPSPAGIRLTMDF